MHRSPVFFLFSFFGTSEYCSPVFWLDIYQLCPSSSQVCVLPGVTAKSNKNAVLPFISNYNIVLCSRCCIVPLNLSDLRASIDVKFPKGCGTSTLPANYLETEKLIKEMKWKGEKIQEDMQREQALLNHAMFSFEVKKKEFIKYLAESSSHVTQVMMAFLASMKYFNLEVVILV